MHEQQTKCFHPCIIFMHTNIVKRYMCVYMCSNQKQPWCVVSQKEKRKKKKRTRKQGVSRKEKRKKKNNNYPVKGILYSITYLVIF